MFKVWKTQSLCCLRLLLPAVWAAPPQAPPWWFSPSDSELVMSHSSSYTFTFSSTISYPSPDLLCRNVRCKKYNIYIKLTGHMFVHHFGPRRPLPHYQGPGMQWTQPSAIILRSSTMSIQAEDPGGWTGIILNSWPPLAMRRVPTRLVWSCF